MKCGLTEQMSAAHSLRVLEFYEGTFSPQQAVLFFIAVYKVILECLLR